MPTDPKSDPAKLLDRLITEELPSKRGLEAWTSFLQAHASLMRQLEADLEKHTGLALADFDVLAQLANAGGELRMTELANRALISRSGMTRRLSDTAPVHLREISKLFVDKLDDGELEVLARALTKVTLNCSFG